MDQPKPRFTGIFIPVEILEMEELSLLEQILLAWIDALYCEDRGGCYASNEYLANRLKVQQNTIAKALTHLRSLGLIEDVCFDGRNRVIRALINKKVDATQSKAALDKNPTLGWTKIQPCVGEKSIPSYRERKEERKDHIPPTPKGVKGGGEIPSSQSKKSKVPKEVDKPKKIVNLSQQQIDQLYQQYGKPLIDELVLEIEDYCLSTGKRYKCYAATVRNWIRRRNANPQAQPKNTVDRRRRDNFGNLVSDPLTDNLF